ncbi:hypothetical protein C3747_330g27 [Trypanosoma cruzi]|uniref:Uncharacterized protein n=2 Tax=Trypanosoma cruzi TaxID=5693 RepID=Q4DD25_TRYCC|nr:hypothetical protein Tc00.1047053507143.30 [Trypanosoma cruzi]EAN90423.1 hypothetical protein Tc00.1047053507143.30 [Trypanosoma cruzi]PWU91919.1 hypothetical protein C3747_330g27 [Trypanosoma cruzi]RNC55737.1 hypothetical protein TcCL_ESM06775 [Trypanosoma cruzi]|eukprot:XP_812274.1 hypothetical protein [Trypanosoma cruzi strain CL Brener]
MRKNPSLGAFLRPQQRRERDARLFDHDSFDERQWSGQHEMGHRGGVASWDRHDSAYTSYADYDGGAYEPGAPRVSDTLQPRLVNDIGLQRALKRPSMRSSRVLAHGMDGVRRGRENVEQPKEEWRETRFSLKPYENFDSRGGRDAVAPQGDIHEDHAEHARHGWEQHTPSVVGETVHSPRPLVDVSAAFGRMSSSTLDHMSNAGRSHSASATNRAAPSLSPLPSAPSHGAADASIDLSRARESIKLEGVNATTKTTSPRLHIEQPSAEISTQDRYRGWKPSMCENENVLAGSSWAPVYGPDGFSVIQSTLPDSGAVGQYQNPNAAAERILYALLQQNEELSTVASHQPNKWGGEKLSLSNGKETSSSITALDPVARQRLSLHVTPQESRLVLNLVREKDREILRLRSSLATSYRFAAYAAYRQCPSGPSGKYNALFSAMESRFFGALASAVKNRERDPLLLVDRAPPHVHGLPNLPLPLGLPYSMAQVCGVLSMINVADMLHKKASARFFLSSWRTYFVVADDRGLSVYRSEEDYKRHAFQRTLLVVPFRDMEYFVPSFRDVSVGGEDLLQAAEALGPARTRQQESGSSKFFSSLINRRKKLKAETTMKNKKTGGIEAGETEDTSDAVNSQEDEGRESLNVQRKRPDRYDELMACIAMQHAGDTSHAYFGFIPKQPNTQSGGKVVNPPVLFRTQSTQEHMEWAHYFAQCFNRKLYREMFPTALAETYAGSLSRETQTVFDTTDTAALEGHDVNEWEKREPMVASKEVMAMVQSVEAAAQTTPREKNDEATNTEEEQDVAGLSCIVTPPPPPTSPPRRSVIGTQEASGSVYESVEEEGESDIKSNAMATMESALTGEVGKDVPWKELVTELRRLLDTKNTERQELQEECEELRLRVRQLMRELQQLKDDRESLLKELEEVHVMYDAAARRVEEAERSFQSAQEAAHTAEAAKQEAVTREEEQAARANKLREEIECMQHEQEILTAEILALKDGYSEGLRCLAKKALGDIDQLHAVCTAGEYLSALRGGHCDPPRKEDGWLCAERREGNTSRVGSNDHIMSPQQQGPSQPPHAPPPATSLHQPLFHPHRKKQQCDPMHVRSAPENPNVPQHASAAKKTSDNSAPADAGEGFLGIAMLLISFMPQHMAIDGCFTVDESQARLLRSGPSPTQRGREWVILHHDTNAVFSVTAELRTEKEPRHNEPSKSPQRSVLSRRARLGSSHSVHPNSARRSRERISRAADVEKTAKRAQSTTDK